eukprot:11473780-Heterocapsa_arctica.AAC.1
MAASQFFSLALMLLWTEGRLRSCDLSRIMSTGATSYPHHTSAHATGALGPEKRSRADGTASLTAGACVFQLPEARSSGTWEAQCFPSTCAFAGWRPPHTRPLALVTPH